MTTEQLRGMADEAFVEILAQRVVEKLLARQKQALVVYTGSNIGEAAALEAMGRLRGEGFTFRALVLCPACRRNNSRRHADVCLPAFH